MQDYVARLRHEDNYKLNFLLKFYILIEYKYFTKKIISNKLFKTIKRHFFFSEFSNFAQYCRYYKALY